MEKLTQGYDWKKCHYCGADYDKWCRAWVIKNDTVGPKEVGVKCRSCGTVYQVRRVVSWRVRKMQGITHSP